jgi:aspartate/glutamate/glutamine transport system substrate-binding protein
MFGRVVLLAVALAPVAAHAGKLDEIRARGKLIVSVKNDAQHAHKDPAHFQKRGFEVELAQALARRILGDESRLELKILARPVRLPFLATGAVDLVVSMIPVTAENSAQCDFSHPYFSSGLSLLLAGNAQPLKLGDLAGKTIAFRKQSYNNHGAELQRLAQERGIKVNVRYYATFDEAVKSLTTGEAVAMGGNFVDLEAYRNAHPGFTVNDNLLEERRIGVAVKKGEPELLKIVNDTIDELKRTGELKRLTDKWHLPYLLPAT